LSYTYAQHSRVAVVRFDFLVNWHLSIQISLEVSLSLKVVVYWRVFNKDLFENVKMKDVKENSVIWIDWDNNR